MTGENKVKVTDDYLIRRKERDPFEVEQKDWNWLKNMVNNIFVPVKWFELLIGFFLSAFLSFLICWIADQDLIYLILIAASLLIVGLLIVFLKRERGAVVYDKKQIIDFMKEMEVNRGDESKP